MHIDYSRYPRPESIRFFEVAVRKHARTSLLEKLEDFHYRINRINMPSLDVVVTNHYTIGLSDYYEIIGEYPQVDGIITISNWNGYTHQVKDIARDQQVGIFVMTEFLGALNYSEPYKYIKKDDKGRDIFFGRY